MNTADIEIGTIGGTGRKQALKWEAEITAIWNRLGRKPTDDELLDAARDPASSFHAYVFNVSEKEAARKYYIERVQFIMRNVAAIQTNVDGEKVKFRLFVRTPDGYERVTEIEPKSATAEAVARSLAFEIASAHRRAEAWRVILSPADKKRADAVIGYLNKAKEAVGDPSALPTVGNG